MRGFYSLLIMLLAVMLFMPVASMCDQACMEPTIAPLELMLLTQAVATQDAQISMRATEFNRDEHSQNTETTFMPANAEPEVSAVRRGYKPVAADQYNGELNYLDKMYTLIRSSSSRAGGTMRTSAPDLGSATPNDVRPNTLRPVESHQRV